VIICVLSGGVLWLRCSVFCGCDVLCRFVWILRLFGLWGWSILWVICICIVRCRSCLFWYWC